MFPVVERNDWILCDQEDAKDELEVFNEVIGELNMPFYTIVAKKINKSIKERLIGPNQTKNLSFKKLSQKVSNL